MRVALASLCGAPGVTTAALALALGRAARGDRVMLVEADPGGGALAATLRVPEEPGLVQLAAGARQEQLAGVLPGCLRPLTERVDVLLAPASPARAAAALSLVSEALGELVRSVPTGIVDCGRLTADSQAEPVAAGCDVLLVLAQPTLPDVAVLLSRLAELEATFAAVAVVLSEPAVRTVPVHPLDEVAELLGSRATVAGQLPQDPAAVRRLLSGDWPRRSRLRLAVDQTLDALEQFGAARYPVGQAPPAPVEAGSLA